MFIALLFILFLHVVNSFRQLNAPKMNFHFFAQPDLKRILGSSILSISLLGGPILLPVSSIILHPSAALADVRAQQKS